MICFGQHEHVPQVKYGTSPQTSSCSEMGSVPICLYKRRQSLENHASTSCASERGERCKDHRDPGPLLRGGVHTLVTSGHALRNLMRVLVDRGAVVIAALVVERAVVVAELLLPLTLDRAAEVLVSAGALEA